MKDESTLLGTIAVIGAVLGLGQLLASGDKLTARIVVGRAIVSGGLGLCAGAMHIILPDMSLIAYVGACCVLVSLGTSAIERMFQKVIAGKTGGG